MSNTSPTRIFTSTVSDRNRERCDDGESEDECSDQSEQEKQAILPKLMIQMSTQPYATSEQERRRLCKPRPTHPLTSACQKFLETQRPTPFATFIVAGNWSF
jgi:hypothetical protein